MKKLILTLTLVAAVVSAYGQGTVAFSNTALTRNSLGASGQVPTTAGLLKYGLWYGVGSAGAISTTAAPWAIGVNSTTALGLIASSADAKTALNNVSLGTETSPAEQDVWCTIIAWSAQYADWQAGKAAFDAGTIGTAFYQWAPLNVNSLGNPAVSGATLWENATGTNPKLFNAAVIPQAIPEPTSFALAGLGAAALLIFRRRK